MGLQLTVTGLGDLFPATCVAVAVSVWCWVRLNRLLAAVFATSFAGSVVAAFILKLVAGALAPPLDEAGLLLSQGAPSGHATGAAMVYGAAIVLFLRACKGWTAGLGVVYSLGVIVVVCVTRLSLHTHTLADVAAGLAVGFCFAALFDRALRAQIRPGMQARASELLAVLIVVAGLALASGVRISSTQFL